MTIKVLEKGIKCKMRIPMVDECINILVEQKLPAHIIEHSKAVCKIASDVVDTLKSKNINVDKDLVIAGALLHDVRRLDKDHAKTGGQLLEGLGLIRVAKIVKTHGLIRLGEKDFTPKTLEEKIVFYADKRVVNNKIVSLEKRFKYLKETYGTEEKLYYYTKEIENELLGIPGNKI